MAIEILHPTNPVQSQNAKITAALTPKVFNVLYTEGLHRASESTLANHLIQNAFTPDGAAKAAGVFLSNISFANLDGESMIGPSDAKKDQIKKSLESGTFSMHPVSRQIIADEAKTISEQIRPKESVLATYTAPLKYCDATITFTGKKLTADDFESLKKFVEFAKESYTARQQAEPEPTYATGPLEPPNE